MVLFHVRHTDVDEAAVAALALDAGLRIETAVGSRKGFWRRILCRSKFHIASKTHCFDTTTDTRDGAAFYGRPCSELGARRGPC